LVVEVGLEPTIVTV